MAGLLAFAIPTALNMSARTQDQGSTSHAVLLYLDVAVAILAAFGTFSLLTEARLINARNLWLPIQLDRLTLFAFCFTAYQLLDLHAVAYSYLEGHFAFSQSTFAFEIIRRAVTSIALIFLLPYIYEVERRHGQSTDDPTPDAIPPTTATSN